MNRRTVLVCAAVVLAAASAVFVLRARPHDAAASGDLRLDEKGRMFFRDTRPGRDQLFSVDRNDPNGPRRTSALKCLRFATSAGTGVCLRSTGSLAASFEAVILDAGLGEKRRIPLAGTPSRARVSPSGRMADWTLFVSGDSYGSLDFSTRTGIVDTWTGTYVDDLEGFTVEGMKKKPDFNFWGVTFTRDDDTFYATLATGGRTYLVRGSFSKRTFKPLRENVECPSLSPDGTRLAFKKRIRGADSGSPWHLYVLDLATMRESPVPEERSVDDQVLWLDDRTLAYAVSGDFGNDVWTVPATAPGAPVRMLTAAASPALSPG